MPRVSSGTRADNDLAALVAGGDKTAFAELYDRYRKQSFSLAKRICVATPIAEDVVQEAFLGFWRDPSRFDPTRGSFATWMLTLVHHRAVDAVRRETTQRKRALPEAEYLTDQVLPPTPGADDAALDGVIAGQVREALTQLSAEQRKVIALSYFGGYTQAEVAAVTGLPIGTVKSRTFAAVRKLRTVLTGVLGDTRGVQS